MNKKQVTILIVSLALVAAGAAAWVWSVRQKSASRPQETGSRDESMEAPTAAEVPRPEEGFKQYVNRNLGYGFSYPDTESLYECPTSPPPYVPCLLIERISLRVEPLGKDLLSSDIQNSLLNEDLYCNADGASGSTKCTSTKVEEFGNPSGAKGYKVFRTRTFEAYYPQNSRGEHEDVAFVMVFPGIRNAGEREYAGMLFAVDSPSDANYAGLKAIVDSFFTF